MLEPVGRGSSAPSSAPRRSASRAARSENSSTSGPFMRSHTFATAASKPEAGLDRHGQEVEHVRHLRDELLLAAASSAWRGSSRAARTRRRRRRARPGARSGAGCRSRAARRPNSRNRPDTDGLAGQVRGRVGAVMPAAISLRRVPLDGALRRRAQRDRREPLGGRPDDAVGHALAQLGVAQRVAAVASSRGAARPRPASGRR